MYNEPTVPVSVTYSPFVAYKEPPPPELTFPAMRVYQRRDDGTLATIASQGADVEETVLACKEHWVNDKSGWNHPVLAVIEGGKK